MNILFIDTETNGKAKNFRAPMNDMNNWPRITQLVWQVINLKQEPLKQVDKLIKPDGWIVPKEQFFIDQGISTERLEIEGEPLPEILIDLMKDIEDFGCDIIVAHNVNFDKNVTGCELIRYNVKPVTPNKKPLWICTMEASTDFCKLPGSYGKYKWPKLEELHFILFKEHFDGAHDALVDTTIAAKCFFELVRLGVIVLPETYKK